MPQKDQQKHTKARGRIIAASRASFEREREKRTDAQRGSFLFFLSLFSLLASEAQKSKGLPPKVIYLYHLRRLEIGNTK